MSEGERLAERALRRMAERTPPPGDPERSAEQRARLVGRLERFHGEVLAKPRRTRRFTPWLIAAAAFVASTALAAVVGVPFRSAAPAGSPHALPVDPAGDRGAGPRSPAAPSVGVGAPRSEAAVAAAVEPTTQAVPPTTRESPEPRVAAPHPAASAGPESTLSDQNARLLSALRARRSGDDATALVELDALLAKYPRGAVSQEAEVERLRALKRLGRSEDAARAARRYLARHPKGFAADEARTLTFGGTGPAPQANDAP